MDKYIARDGHICDSRIEVFIDNLLYKSGIKHTKSDKYPFDEKFNKSGRKKCDWKIGDTYVEYLGCMEHRDPIVRRKYRDTANDKAEMCVNNGWNFIHITPDSIINIKNDIIEEFGGIKNE